MQTQHNTSRNLVHFNHLPTLTEWATGQGWASEPPKTDAWEVLRLRKGKQVAIFHKRADAKVHVTVHGESAKLARDFLRWYKARDQPNAHATQQPAA